jgi:hypothetical protein
MFMRESGDSSVWKSLAVAFGDGLAFGVGMKLTQHAQRQASLPAAAEGGDILDRLEQIEQRMRRIESAPAGFDQNVLEAITAALDARLNELASQVERRLAEMQARILMETKALEQQDRSLATQIEQDLSTLKGQVITLNREFAEQVGRIVAEEVASQVQARTTGLEQSLRAHAIDAADDAVQERLAPMRAEVARKDSEVAELRQHMAATDSTVVDFILGMGEMCRKAAERLAPAPEPGPPTPVTETAPPLMAQAKEVPAQPPPLSPPEAPGEDAGAELRDHFDHPVGPPVPSFSQLRKPGGFWRMPMVSSFIVAAAGLAMLHFL